jgi:hypothetical protein
MMAMEYRCGVFSEVWEREKTVIVKKCNAKKTKKKQALMKKLHLLKQEIKDAVIKAYLLRCKVRYSVAYSEWRIAILN